MAVLLDAVQTGLHSQDKMVVLKVTGGETHALQARSGDLLPSVGNEHSLPHCLLHRRYERAVSSS